MSRAGFYLKQYNNHESLVYELSKGCEKFKKRWQQEKYEYNNSVMWDNLEKAKCSVE